MAALKKEPLNGSSIDGRKSDRFKLNLRISGQGSEDKFIEFSVDNLSDGGFSFLSSDDMSVGDVLVIRLPDATVLRANVIWSDKGRFGCQFERQLTQAQLAAARLKAEPVINPAQPEVDLDAYDDTSSVYPGNIRALIWLTGVVVPWAIVYFIFSSRN